MSLSVEDIAREIVVTEGGFVNDPDDPGGATNYGVTIGTLRKLGIDLDGDGDIDVDDVRLLTVDRAVDIFLEHYLIKPGIDKLSATLIPTVFDMSVNAGQSRAIKLLQQTVNQAGFGPLEVDGGLGPATLSAQHLAAERMGQLLPDAYSIARRDFYYGLSAKRPRLRKFSVRRDGGKGGWIKRAEMFIQSTFHLTDAQHRSIVSSWT